MKFKGSGEGIRKKPAELLMSYDQRLETLQELTKIENPELIESTLADLRKEIDSMEFMGSAPNSFAIKMGASNWAQFIFHPADEQHGLQLKQILNALSIQPWEENGELAVDYGRDVEILRHGLIFEYAVEYPARKLKEQKAHEEAEKLTNQIERRRKQDAVIEGTNKLLAALKKIPIQDTGEIEADPRYQYPYPWRPTTPAKRLLTHTPENRLVEEYTLPADEEINAATESFMNGEIEELVPKTSQTEYQQLLTMQQAFPDRYLWKDGQARNIKTGEILTAEQINTLNISARAYFDNPNDPSAQELISKVICLNLGLVFAALRRVLSKTHELQDAASLFSEGLRGFLRSVETYDPDNISASKFSSWAFRGIETRMRNFAVTQTPVSIRTPHNVSAKKSEAYRLLDTALKEYYDVRRELSPEDRSRQSALSEYEYRYFKKAGKFDKDNYLRSLLLNVKREPVEVLDQEARRDVVDARGDNLHTEASQDNDLSYEDIRRELSKVLLQLSPREERILRLRFGFNEKNLDNITSDSNTDSGGKTLEEISNLFGVGRERIRQIERRALRKMKQPGVAKRLLDFLDSLSDQQ